MKNTICRLLALVALAAPVSSQAVDGTITINGTIVNNTCTVQLNGGSATSATITLPSIAKSSLPTSASVAGRTAFTIGLTGCTAATVMNTYFEPNTGSINTSGRVGNGNQGGAATGVDVQILQLVSGSLGVVNLAGTLGNQNVTAAASSTTPTQTFFAQYYATSTTVTPGSFTGSFSYTIVYP